MSRREEKRDQRLNRMPGRYYHPGKEPKPARHLDPRAPLREKRRLARRANEVRERPEAVQARIAAAQAKRVRKAEKRKGHGEVRS